MSRPHTGDPRPPAAPSTDVAVDLDRVRAGLRMAQPPDPARLAAERAELAALEAAPAATRLRGYLRLVGPGYLQSAMTLGGGTAASSLFAGAAFGYELLWVAPVAMVIGVIMLAAISYQTLSTGMRPFAAMRRHAGAPFAWGWALGAVLSSVIWHFPQYSLASACLVDVLDVAGVPGVPPVAMAFVVLAWAVALSMLYGRSEHAIRLYERILKYMVWAIVVCFGAVVVRTGVRDWGELAAGFVPFRFPGEVNGVSGWTVAISGLTAAVGINMVFLYPYSLLARGWGREHRRLARFDLYTGTLLPYVLATSLMVIATANTLHLQGFSGTSLQPIEAARVLGGTVGETFGRVVFNLGVMGMALSSITLQMLVCGFVASEVFGWEVGSRRYRLATLLPAPGVLGPVVWGQTAIWLAVPANIACGMLLPIAYLGFTLLMRNRRYLGADRPSGAAGSLWIATMGAVTLGLTAFLAYYVYTWLTEA